MKAYPAQVNTQTAIVAATAIAKEVGDLDRIAAIEIATTKRGYQQTGSRPGEMGAGYQGDRRSQPALYHGSGNVRRRHQ